MSLRTHACVAGLLACLALDSHAQAGLANFRPVPPQTKDMRSGPKKDPCAAAKSCLRGKLAGADIDAMSCERAMKLARELGCRGDESSGGPGAKRDPDDGSANSAGGTPVRGAEGAAAPTERGVDPAKQKAADEAMASASELMDAINPLLSPSNQELLEAASTAQNIDDAPVEEDSYGPARAGASPTTPSSADEPWIVQGSVDIPFTKFGVVFGGGKGKDGYFNSFVGLQGGLATPGLMVGEDSVDLGAGPFGFSMQRGYIEPGWNPSAKASGAAGIGGSISASPEDGASSQTLLGAGASATAEIIYVFTPGRSSLDPPAPAPAKVAPWYERYEVPRGGRR